MGRRPAISAIGASTAESGRDATRVDRRPADRRYPGSGTRGRTRGWRPRPTSPSGGRRNRVHVVAAPVDRQIGARFSWVMPVGGHRAGGRTGADAAAGDQLRRRESQFAPPSLGPSRASRHRPPAAAGTRSIPAEIGPAYPGRPYFGISFSATCAATHEFPGITPLSPGRLPRRKAWIGGRLRRDDRRGPGWDLGEIRFEGPPPGSPTAPPPRRSIPRTRRSMSAASGGGRPCGSPGRQQPGHLLATHGRVGPDIEAAAVST